MRCVYINLDSALSRRERLERNFAQHARAGWSLVRFSAVDRERVQRENVPGVAKQTEKACFYSHKLVIKENLGLGEHLMIVEDDVAFGPSTCSKVENVIRNCERLEWDILFTDICVPDLPAMMRLVRMRSDLTRKGQMTVLDLAELSFGSSTSYILNARSLAKVYELLDNQVALDLPYDLFLRKLITERKLNGLVVFPFLTSLSEQSEVSQIQPEGELSPELVWNTFRKMIWRDRQLDDVKPLLQEIDEKFCDEEVRLFGTLFAAMVSKNLLDK